MGMQSIPVVDPDTCDVPPGLFAVEVKKEGGKFSDTLARFLWNLSMESMQDDECGDCDTEGEAYLLFKFPDCVIIIDGNGVYVARGFILRVDSAGAVDYDSYETTYQLNKAWERICRFFEKSEAEEE